VEKQNLAARAGRWSAAHWKTATLAWLVFVVVAVVVGRAAGTVKLTDAEQGTGETAKAQAILASAGFDAPAGESVLVQNANVSARSSQFAGTLAAIAAKLRTLPEVTDVRAPTAISKDGHSALVQFDMRGNADDAYEDVQPVLDAVAGLQRSSPSYRIAEFGTASATKELNDTVGQDFKKAEYLSVPVTLVILLFAFGAGLAALVPVLLAFSAVLASIGLAALVSHGFHASDATNSVVLMIGMAVGVDYSLFYLKREREERLRGLPHAEALGIAAATSGQAILISGCTVLIAMAGMLLSGSAIFTSIGVGTMIVVFTSMIGSLTVLPALLSKLGGWVDRSVIAAGVSRLTGGRVAEESLRLLPRLKRDDNQSRFWNAVLRPVLRFPAPASALAAGGLIMLSVPVLGIHTKLPSFTDLPKDIPIVQTYKQLVAAFPGTPTPAQVVLEAPDVTSPAVKRTIASFERAALATGQTSEPIQEFVNPDRTVARIEVPLAGDGDNAVSIAALETLRRHVIPATLGTIAGAQVAVTGETAGTHDFNQTMKERFPLVFAFVLGLAFLLLLLTFRSIVIPITSILLNLLSVGAAYGVLVVVFQWGHLQGLLGFTSNHSVVTWLPLFLFTVLFGLSMDYHVFILSRIKEHRDRGEPTSQAVANGIRTTASTVTAAAVVMVAVFSIFASLRTIDIKQMGVGLAVAVLVDVTVIRGVLVPAVMKLLGDRNWYLPRRLGWLPSISFERPSRERAPAPALD
jgi:putative drug exporter of the RND superfamily